MKLPSDALCAAAYADYMWSKGKPKGISPLEDPSGHAHFRCFEVEGGMRVEQFDGAGKFLRLVHCPQDRQYAGTTYELSDDHTHKVVRAASGTVRFYEEYTWPGGLFDENVYPQVKTYNAEGRLIAEHRPTQVAEDAWDIYVLDALGKLRVILHHTDVKGGEPCTITEEWM